MKPFLLVVCLLLDLNSIHAASIDIEQTFPNSAERREQTSSTLQPFDFAVGLSDPSVNFNSFDLFTNASNSHKDKPRTQNIFVHVWSKKTGKAVPFILQESGTGGYKGHSQGIFMSVIVPFSPDERGVRIKEAIKEYNKAGPSKVFDLPSDISPITFFDTYEVNESKPGEYTISVDFISPTGKISSKVLDFTIRDKGNLYLTVLKSITADK